MEFIRRIKKIKRKIRRSLVVISGGHALLGIAFLFVMHRKNEDKKSKKS